ncbi:putative major facilitator superfamily transporter [Streptomyces sp. NBRC 110611]|uniref:MFS transporter n=1 Tax=Streptomyces sp. NBRC 110611 TaxID=1621259 RepID=UPI00083693F1|nr:MFS transporter [Streptomyces sp. NBRC 110611]GAU70563.1 putative major facilitator superfamily transporter [Streptomyces sp. NBRC 110611]
MQRILRLGRGATFAYFALNGFLMGMWIVHIPVVEQRTGIGHALLGWLLLLLGAGAFAGMRLAGPLTDRIGPRKAVPLGAALCSCAVPLPGLATDAWGLGTALLVLGLGNGVLDVSMNTHAVQVERGYGRPVMSAFHAMFSVGGVLAALAGALTLGLGWSPATALGITAAGGLALTALAVPALLPHDPTPPDETEGAAESGATRMRRTTSRGPSRVWILAVLAFMLMLCEGVANDWSVLHLKSVLGAPVATAAFAYGAFATAMTTGRLLTDRLAGRYGPPAVLRYGSALATVGLTLAAVAPTTPLALIGWTATGAGLSGCIPQLFSAAGHLDPGTAGANVSRVAGLGYLGMLAGPAVIGPLTHLVPLNLTLLLPVAFCIITACTAHILKPSPSTATDSTPSIPLEGTTR